MNHSIHIQLEPYHSGYLPTVIASRFWTLKKNYIQLNDTVTTVPLKIWFNSYRECIQVAMPALSSGVYAGCLQHVGRSNTRTIGTWPWKPMKTWGL
jgi:hypothetical protein